MSRYRVSFEVESGLVVSAVRDMVETMHPDAESVRVEEVE